MVVNVNTTLTITAKFYSHCVVFKLLERILFTRIELFDLIKPLINPLQRGFKKQQGCLMTSFLIKEAIQFAKEKGSKVYACFLDVRKAFYQVWHDGLFYKLYNCGINRTILKVIMNFIQIWRVVLKHRNINQNGSPFNMAPYKGK